ncbi:hypothetical protein ACWCYL_32215 [Streptomyces sp. 900105755]
MLRDSEVRGRAAFIGPAGTPRFRAKTAHAVELTAVLGSDRMDQFLVLAAAARRFAEDDLVSLLEHIAALCRLDPVDSPGLAPTASGTTLTW